MIIKMKHFIYRIFFKLEGMLDLLWQWLFAALIADVHKYRQQSTENYRMFRRILTLNLVTGLAYGTMVATSLAVMSSFIMRYTILATISFVATIIAILLLRRFIQPKCYCDSNEKLFWMGYFAAIFMGIFRIVKVAHPDYEATVNDLARDAIILCSVAIAAILIARVCNKIIAKLRRSEILEK